MKVLRYGVCSRSKSFQRDAQLSLAASTGSHYTSRIIRRRREMYTGHARLFVLLSVCLSAAACPHYCTDPDVTWGNGRGCPLVVHYWADLQSVNGLRCYGNIARTLNVSECFFSLCAWLSKWFVIAHAIVGLKEYANRCSL